MSRGKCDVLHPMLRRTANVQDALILTSKSIKTYLYSGKYRQRIRETHDGRDEEAELSMSRVGFS